MPGIFYYLLHIHGIITKCCLCLTFCRLKCLLQLLFFSNYTDSFSAASCGSLYHHWISKLLRSLICLFHILYNPITPWDYRHICLNHHCPGIGFVAHRINNRWIRSDKLNIALFTHCRKCTILRQKSESRMNCLRLLFYRGTDDIRHIVITVCRLCRANTNRLIRKLGMKCLPVRLRKNCYRFNSHLTACPDNPDCDFSPICY